MQHEFYASEGGEVAPDWNGDESLIEKQRVVEVDGLTIFKIVFEVCAAILLIVILYFLLSGNIKAVQEACDGLWALLLCRVIMSILTGIVLTIGTWWYAEYMKMWWWHVFFLTYFLMFGIAELAVIPRAVIGNSICIDTLSDNSPTGTPILSIFGWIMLGMDWSVIIVMGCAVVLTRRSAAFEQDGNDWRYND